MIKINKPTSTKYKRFANIPLLILVVAGLLLSGCEDDPGGTDNIDAPVVTSTTPEDNAEDVPVNTPIEATFNEELDENSVNTQTFSLTTNGTPVTGTLTMDGNTVTLTPSSNLNTNSEYVATISSDIENTDEISMEEEFQWSFTTTDVGDTSGVDTTDAIIQDTLTLGSTSGFALLSRNGITNTGTTEINGNVGISPGASTDISGFDIIQDTTGEFATAEGINGNIYASDFTGGTPDMLTQAEEDVIGAYDDSRAAERGDPSSLTGDLNGQTLTPGLYEAESVNISQDGILTLDAEGDPDAVFIIRSNSINTESGSEVALTGNAQPQNVFWVSDSDISLGENSRMSGTLVGGGNIDLQNESQLNGRLLLQGENANEVNLNGSTITAPGVSTVSNDM